MKTEELITLLARESGAEAAGASRRQILFASCGATLFAIVLTAALIGLRALGPEDLADARYWLREAFCALLTLGAWLATARLGVPGARGGSGPWLAAVALITMWAIALGTLQLAPEGERLALVLGQTARSCPFLIAMVSVPFFALSFWYLKSRAPTQLRRAGFTAGFAAGAAGALVYTLHCPEIAPPFLGVWYVLGILIPAAVGAALGPRLLAW